MTMSRWLLLALLLALPAPVRAQDPVEERLRALEARLKAAEERLKAIEGRFQAGVPLFEDAVDDRSPDPFRLVGWEAGVSSGALAPTTPDEGAARTWLKLSQAPDGRWPTTTGRDIAVTSRVLLAFLGNGHTHRFGTFKVTVNKGLTWLKRQQTEDGWIGARGDPLAILDHVMATAFLCEAYAVSRDFTLKPYAQRAVDALLLARRPDGGFGLTRPRAASNTLCTTYGVFALRGAKTSGLDLAPGTLEGIASVFSATTAPDGRTGLFAPGDAASVSLGNADAPRVPLLTAGAAISHLFMGGKRDGPWFAAARANLTSPDPLQDEPAYWYLGTYAQFQGGGDAWKAWQPAVLGSLHALQQADGPFRPAGLWGDLGGAVGTTAECLLTLEVLSRASRSYPRSGE